MGAESRRGVVQSKKGLYLQPADLGGLEFMIGCRVLGLPT